MSDMVGFCQVEEMLLVPVFYELSLVDDDCFALCGFFE